MRAAVVSSFDSPPTYQEYPTPVPGADGEILVDVLAAGLHPRVRSQANGSHYASLDEPPLVPGIDGVGRGPDGLLRYFIQLDTAMGTMAEQTVVDRRRSVVLPTGTDPIAVAAAMNPAMSSWIALRQRIRFEPGASVLILGATGSSGQLAVQVARHLGAARVIAAGRNPQRLDALPAVGATDCVSLEGPPDELRARVGAVAADVDVVLDYIWGEVSGPAMAAVVTARHDRSRPLSWIEIGSVGGSTATIPSAALRAARLQIVGSGQGSVSTHDILAELPGLAAEITAGSFTIDSRTVPLADVTAAWTAPPGPDRIVLVP